MLSTLALAALLAAPASPQATAAAPRPEAGWELSGGQAEILLNRHLLADLGLELSGDRGRPSSEGFAHRLFEIGSDHPALVLANPGASFRGLSRGSLWLQGELELVWEAGRLELSSVELVPSTVDRAQFDLQTLDGRRPFFLDNAHARFSPESGEYEFLNLDLRVSDSLAERLGRPEVGGIAVGAAHIRSRVVNWASPAERGSCVPDGDGDVDVELIEIGTLDPVFHDAQKVAMAPSAKLRNVGTIDVDWYRSIEPDGAEPLGNPAIVGPHPYLASHLYRLVDGSFHQIGQADVKHAFFAANSNCLCPGAQILRVGCEDLYGAFTNWNRKFLAPRDEITASSGEWTRFGSHFDGTPPPDDFRDHEAGDHDNFEHRLTAAASDLLVAGARYFVEGWYVARGDTNIFNSMGYREVNPRFVSNTWTFEFALGDTLTLGPAVDAWVDPVSPPPGTSVTIIDECDVVPDDCDGHVQVSSQATLGPNGLTRYDYTVMNLDFDRQIDSFSVPLPAGITVTNASFHDPDDVAGNDWGASVTPGVAIQWDLPLAETSALDWGTLYSFRFEANATATDVTADLGVFEAGMPELLTAASKGPSASLFSVAELSVSSTGSGSGGVTSAPVGIDCGADCDELYVSGAPVTVSAAGDPGSALIRWTESGLPVGTDDDFDLTLTADRSLVAVFELCNRTLDSVTVVAAEAFEACEILLTGTLFVVEATGDAVLRAGSVVGLANGFSVDSGGELRVEIDPAMLP